MILLDLIIRGKIEIKLEFYLQNSSANLFRDKRVKLFLPFSIRRIEGVGRNPFRARIHLCFFSPAALSWEPAPLTVRKWSTGSAPGWRAKLPTPRTKTAFATANLPSRPAAQPRGSALASEGAGAYREHHEARSEGDKAGRRKPSSPLHQFFSYFYHQSGN